MAGDGRVITLAIVDKVPRAKGPGLVVQEFGKGPGSTLLLAVAEASTKRSAQACESIATALQGIKKSTSTSLTTQIMAGIEKAHRALVEANGESAGRDPVAAGVGCVLIKGPLALVAQAGPGFVCWTHGDGLTVSAPDLGAGSRANALGIARKLHVHFNRCSLKPGTTIVLGSSPLTQLVTGDELKKLLSADLATAAQQLYRRVRELPNFSGILYRHSAP